MQDFRRDNCRIYSHNSPSQLALGEMGWADDEIEAVQRSVLMQAGSQVGEWEITQIRKERTRTERKDGLLHFPHHTATA